MTASVRPASLLWSATAHLGVLLLIWLGSLLAPVQAPSFSSMQVDLSALELPAPAEEVAPAEPVEEAAPDIPPEPAEKEALPADPAVESRPEASDPAPEPMPQGEAELPREPEPVREPAPVEPAPAEAAKPPAPAETTPPAPEAAPPTTEVGDGALVGARADGGVEDYYLALVEQKIGRRWRPTRASLAGRPELSAVVRFRVGLNGEVVGASLEDASGLGVFDRQALRAVLDAAPLPKPPARHAAGLEIRFHFHYAP